MASRRPRCVEPRWLGSALVAQSIYRLAARRVRSRLGAPADTRALLLAVVLVQFVLCVCVLCARARACLCARVAGRHRSAFRFRPGSISRHPTPCRSPRGLHCTALHCTATLRNTVQERGSAGQGSTARLTRASRQARKCVLAQTGRQWAHCVGRRNRGVRCRRRCADELKLGKQIRSGRGWLSIRPAEPFERQTTGLEAAPSCS
ncbi:unnamed protein product [Protopolystoma xenopodis]|uniref:Uncharacterized protein n=1 Tax=Protopolystoma xenopodis TaxID=117903 RepID=A0A3S5B352_9PLAT|nr:unnamed protein product [Protopolystoma xenopodis]